MSEKLRLGALESLTKKYTLPFQAEKNKQYECVDCGKKVILRKGSIRVAHFAHYSETNTCTYLDHPNEGQLHKDAKLLLQKLITDKRLICMTWECDICGGFYAFSEIPAIIYKEGDECLLEYRDIVGKWVADVAIVNNNQVRYIFEIKNTHATETSRPEPWYEIEAASFIKNIQELFGETSRNPDECGFRNDKDYIIEIPCIRKDLIRRCYGSFCYKEPWVRRIPGISKTADNNSCIVCKKKEYELVSDGCTGKFQNEYIRACLECLAQDIYTKKIRNLYSSNMERQKQNGWFCKTGKLEVKENIQDVLTPLEKNLLEYIPKINKKGSDQDWKQDISCFECKRKQYNPFYHERFFYAICKICFDCDVVQKNILDKIKSENIKKPDEYLMID